MNRQDVFMRLFFFFLLMLFGITESLWSSFAGGRQYGVWAGEWHSSCSCLLWWCFSPPTQCTACERSLNNPLNFVSRDLMDTWELFKQRHCPNHGSPPGKREKRSHGRDAGSARSWRTCVTCTGMQQHLPQCWWVGSCCLAERAAKALGTWATLLLYGADVRFSPCCLKWKVIKVQVLFLKAGGVKWGWCNCGAAQRLGVWKVFQNGTVVYPPRFESASDFPWEGSWEVAFP